MLAAPTTCVNVSELLVLGQFENGFSGRLVQRSHSGSLHLLSSQQLQRGKRSNKQKDTQQLARGVLDAIVPDTGPKKA
jgi:hypothetical protein